jgi:hypothetical protein
MTIDGMLDLLPSGDTRKLIDEQMGENDRSKIYNKINLLGTKINDDEDPTLTQEEVLAVKNVFSNRFFEDDLAKNTPFNFARGFGRLYLAPKLYQKQFYDEGIPLSPEMEDELRSGEQLLGIEEKLRNNNELPSGRVNQVNAIMLELHNELSRLEDSENGIVEFITTHGQQIYDLVKQYRYILKNYGEL